MPEPFFIVCAPRSGSTLLRNLLRQHPELECPEETFFYRWSEPFGTRGYERIYQTNKVIMYHRELDGITDEHFAEIYQSSSNRRDLQINYANAFLKQRNCIESTWFDKTPQNVQGILRISHDFPSSKLVHIVRHPLNVISSIMQGRSVGPESLEGALNTWLESVSAASMASVFGSEKLIHLRYEDLAEQPLHTINDLLTKLGFSPLESLSGIAVSPVNTRYLDYLDDSQIDEILSACGSYLDQYDYPADRDSLKEWIAQPIR